MQKLSDNGQEHEISENSAVDKSVTNLRFRPSFEYVTFFKSSEKKVKVTNFAACVLKKLTSMLSDCVDEFNKERTDCSVLLNQKVMESLKETAEYYDLVLLDVLDPIVRSPDTESEYDHMERDAIRSRLKTIMEKKRCEYGTPDKRKSARKKYLVNLVKAIEARKGLTMNNYGSISSFYSNIAIHIAANMYDAVMERKSELLTAAPKQNATDCIAALQPFLRRMEHVETSVSVFAGISLEGSIPLG